MSSRQQPPQCLLIGATELPRFAPILDRLQGVPSIKHATTLSEAAEISAADWSPDIVLVSQSLPDEFNAHDVERLIGRLPLARWIVCFGEWCESIGRTEQLWPIGWCVPLRDALARLEVELLADQVDELILPPTASRDEAFARSAARRNAIRVRVPLTAHVEGNDRHFRELIRDTLRAMGCSMSSVDAELCVLATTCPDHDDRQTIAAWRAAARESVILVASDMATAEDRAELIAVGATEVVSQLRFEDGLQTVLNARGWLAVKAIGG